MEVQATFPVDGEPCELVLQGERLLHDVTQLARALDVGLTRREMAGKIPRRRSSFRPCGHRAPWLGPARLLGASVAGADGVIAEPVAGMVGGLLGGAGMLVSGVESELLVGFVARPVLVDGQGEGADPLTLLIGEASAPSAVTAKAGEWAVGSGRERVRVEEERSASRAVSVSGGRPGSPSARRAASAAARSQPVSVAILVEGTHLEGAVSPLPHVLCCCGQG